MDKHVEFKDAGRWAQHDPSAPQFEVTAGEVVVLDSATADDCVETGRAKFVGDPTEYAASVEDESEAEAEDDVPTIGGSSAPWED